MSTKFVGCWGSSSVMLMEKAEKAEALIQMNLNNFESYIDKKILTRGLDYFNNDCVYSLEEIEGNLFEAEVEGTDLYLVEVKLDDQGNISNAKCDCPYDMGDYCKHQVAVFLALRDRMKKRLGGEEIETERSGGVSDLSKPALTKKATSTEINKILHRMTKDELVDLLTGLASEHPEIKQMIELNFGSGNDANEIKQSVKLIRTYIQKHSDKWGFVHYCILWYLQVVFIKPISH